MASSDRLKSSESSVEARTPHILVVNDTQEILDLFREILEEDGFQVSLSAFAIKDLETILELTPDLVILDFLMGGEEAGWQLLQKMKMDRRTANIPVIACTAALAMVRDLEAHLRAKNVGIVLKPFDIDELLSEVHKLLRPEHDAAATGARSST